MTPMETVPKIGDAVSTHPYMTVIRWFAPIYRWSGYIAGFCIFLVFMITMVQIIGRMVGFNPPGFTNFASYFMAASVFFGLAHTLDAGGQIRIELFLSMSGRARWLIECMGFLLACAICIWMTYYAWSMASWSITLGDISEGMDATPLWIPQASMALGFSLFCLAVIDRTLRLIVLGDHGLAPSPDAL
jgi:TRAP-type mannitol/chloroaromatic compound transport system permease small subunit